MSAVDSAGKACPKCAYVRAAADANPPWQCPKCHIAYAKFGVTQGFVAHGHQMAEEARGDKSLFMLIAVNVLVLGFAYALKVSLLGLMMVYCIQSAVIGVCNFIRIRRLEDLSHDGVTPQPHGPTASFFFALHYGIFHAGYFVFLIGYGARSGELASPLVYALCGGAFALNHFHSLRYNLDKDEEGRPDLGLVTMLPYARILPMHLLLATGLAFKGGPNALLLFGGLKIFADAVMHVIEHHALRPKSGSEPD